VLRELAEKLMSVDLETIMAATRRRVADSRRSADLRALERAAEAHVPRGFRRRLAEVSESAPAVIAELKKASPSKGLIRADFDVVGLARELEAGGAAGLSVLTDEEFFQGSLENLRVASANVRVPCLRKDFIVDEFQVLEARANCADAILLIVAALEQAELTALLARARKIGLDVLCEAHDATELQRALDAGCDLIGVNARDLKTFAVDLGALFRLAEKLPSGTLAVAESGIQSGHDISRLRAAGYGAFLIGETVMRAERPGEALQHLLASAETRVPIV
jgi:indole-3-glycerol phosphate synthase